MSSKFILTAARAAAESVHEPELRFHASVVTTGEHTQIIWTKIEPGGTYPMHSHPHEQVSVLLQGRMRLTVGEEVEEIGPGDMWYVPADVTHGGALLGDEAVVFVDVYAPPSTKIIEYLEGVRLASAG